jgi:spoIIIJ-associated protein
MKAVESEGTTVDQAVERALILLDLPRERVDVEVIREAKSGSQTAVVRVAPKGQERREVSRETRRAEPKRDAEAAEPMSAASPEPLAPEESDQIRAILTEVIGHMGLSCRIAPAAVEEDGQRMRFQISGEDAALVIGRQGQTLDALEVVINRIADRRWPGSMQITVDAEDYRARRAHKLSDIAFEEAGKVRRSGRPIELEPMSPRDRRSVHLALQNEPGVTTRSEGEGQYRHIVIEPAGPLGLSGSRPRR